MNNVKTREAIKVDDTSNMLPTIERYTCLQSADAQDAPLNSYGNEGHLPFMCPPLLLEVSEGKNVKSTSK